MYLWQVLINNRNENYMNRNILPEPAGSIPELLLEQSYEIIKENISIRKADHQVPGFQEECHQEGEEASHQYPCFQPVFSLSSRRQDW